MEMLIDIKKNNEQYLNEMFIGLWLEVTCNIFT